MVNILTLPIELQSQILSHLHYRFHFPCAEVCRLWESILLSLQFRKLRSTGLLPSAHAARPTPLDKPCRVSELVGDYTIKTKIRMDGGMSVKFTGFKLDDDECCALEGFQIYDSSLLDDPIFHFNAYSQAQEDIGTPRASGWEVILLNYEFGKSQFECEKLEELVPPYATVRELLEAVRKIVRDHPLSSIKDAEVRWRRDLRSKESDGKLPDMLFVIVDFGFIESNW
ncbi:hypothetical protein ABW19_dt0209407 [Dactylella cylindrospora]|nr:hypothetical protein ABW19_dt0209407 [Dactylella cylindrospora]